MLKKCFSFLSLLLLGVSTSYGNFCCQNIHPYVGVVGGVAPLSGDYKGQITSTGDVHYATIGNTSGLFGGVLGLEWDFCQGFFFAAQANALYNSTDVNVRKSTNTVGIPNHVVNVKNSFQWGIDGRIGFCLCAVKPYFLAGFESGRWTMELENDSASFNRGIPPFSSLNYHKTLWGPKVGTGVLFPLTHCLTANFEYSYTWFGSISANLNSPAAVGATGTWNHKSTIRQNAFVMGLNYEF